MKTTKSIVQPNTETHSFSNFEDISLKHLELDGTLNFERKVLEGIVHYHFEVMNDKVKEVRLDTRDLKVISVEAENMVEWKMGQVDSCYPPIFGQPIVVTLKEELKKGEKMIMRVVYETTNGGECLQWLNPELTFGKEHPFVYSQAQAIHGRSMFPCQDIPASKFTHSSVLRTPKPLRALMSGYYDLDKSTDTEHYFDQKIPLPSYLLFIGAGKIVGKQIGPRSMLWSEQEILDEAAEDFQQTEKFLQTAEEFLPKYAWGQYNILCLTPSFAYGGMENVLMTTVTPTLLTGGTQELAGVVIHEACHSWSGNLVSCHTWSDFWLNEGFTMMLERLIKKRLFGRDYADMDAILRFKDLKDTINEFMKNNQKEFTKLVQDLHATDPDDNFSVVPYEKGYNFLRYIMLEVVQDEKKWEKFLFDYFTHFQNQSISTDQFKKFILEYFESDDDVDMSVIDWDSWLHKDGHLFKETEFSLNYVNQVKDLVKYWINGASGTPPFDFLKQFSSLQKCYFLDQLMESESPFSDIERLDKEYLLSSSKNCEVRFRFYQLCLVLKHQPQFENIADFAKSYGRLKYCRPLFRGLYELDGNARKLAISTYQQNKHTMHPITCKVIGKVLKLIK